MAASSAIALMHAPLAHSSLQQSCGPSLQPKFSAWHVLHWPMMQLRPPQHWSSLVHSAPEFGQIWQVFAPAVPTQLTLAFTFPQQSLSPVHAAPTSMHVQVPLSPHTPVQQADEGPQTPPCGWQVWQVWLSGLQFMPLQQSPSVRQLSSCFLQAWHELYWLWQVKPLQQTWAVQ